jgi:hypothetical protein
MNSNQPAKERVLEIATLGNRRFEIVFDGEGVGFYLYVFEDGRCTHDHLQDTLELAKSFAEEELGVPVSSWEKGNGNG